MESNSTTAMSPGDFAHVCEAVADQGWFVSDELLHQPWSTGALREVEQLRQSGCFSTAGIGRGGNHEVRQTVRTGENFWLPSEGNPPFLHAYLDFLDQLKAAFNRYLLLGLWEAEVNLAYYPQGAFYKRHVDAFRGGKNRRISTIAYLQSDWQDEDGGLLRMWLPNGESITLEPKAGRFVCFLSEKIPHEVEVCQRPRYSISGWFRVRDAGFPHI